jgi:aromatic-L-amino-acid decarboxylase
MADPRRFPLEPSGAEMRALLDAALERVLAHVESLADQPSVDVEGAAELARSLVEPLPEEGVAQEDLLGLLFDRAIPKSFNTAGPGYLAYIPGGGLFESAVADLIATAVNRYVTVWQAAPALAQIEANVVAWFAGLLRYGDSARGVLTSGGSLANLAAVVTARREKLPADFLRGTIYVSDQVHHSVQKAAEVAGFPAANVRTVPSDEAFRIRVEVAREAVRRDRAAGFRPFLLVGSAGTTNTGAVDDLAAMAALAREEDLWFHVDGAYGGFFVLTDRGRHALRGIEQSDSATLDPHKTLFLPYGTGSLIVRDGEALRRAHSSQADYLPVRQSDPGRVDFCELSPELSREFRGLRVWLPVRLHGIRAFREQLDEKLDLALYAADKLRGMEEVEILAEPQLSTLAFRARPPRTDDAGLDDLNHRLLERINARRRIYLSGTRLRECFAIRICVVSFRTHRDRLDEGLDDIRASVAEVVAGR